MANEQLQARLDRAIIASIDDDLDRDPFIESLVAALVDDIDQAGPAPVRRSTGLVVGLTGEWGLGKSSIINMLAERLESMEQVVVTTFNPWLFKGRDELVEAFFNALRRALGKSTDERFRQALTALDRYRTSIDKAGTKGALMLDAHGAGGTATAVWRVGNFLLGLLKPKPAPTPEEERTKLEKTIAATQSAIVVLIDELDRVEDDEVRAVAQLIKAVGDIKGISYLVAYDPARVTDALGRGGSAEDRRISGEAYLEKIVQMPIPLRPLFADDVSKLLPKALSRHNFELPTPRKGAPYQHEQLIYDELVASIRTPREVKRLAGSFAVLERIVKGEICLWDVLAYSWIASKTPGLRDRLALRLDAMVSDPSTSEMIRRLNLRDGNKRIIETLTDVLGDSAKPHEKMLTLLFPRFNKDSEHPQGTRLARRRNLVRMLYLGNPPGLITREEVERMLALNGDELTDTIKQMREEERLGVLLDRIDDLLPEITGVGESNFWVALSSSMVRETDWATTETNMHSLIEDAGKTLWRLGSSGAGGVERLRTIMEDLISAGDLLLSPWLLRKMLYSHGLTIHSRSMHRSEDCVFDLETTKALLDREAPRYREAFASGFALRRLPDAEALYVLGNADLFDPDLKICVTEQLTSMEAIGSFAVITVPPGFVSDRASMEQFVDPQRVLARLAALKTAHGLPEDPWLRSSIRRLEATLQGRDTHFLGEEDDATDDP